MTIAYYAFNCRLESSEILIRLLLVSKFATLRLEAHKLLMPSAKMLLYARKKPIFLTDYYLIMLIKPQSLAVIVIIIIIGRNSVFGIATR